MTPPVRIALANLPHPSSPSHAVQQAVDAVHDARRAGAAIVCFPECFIPGYRWPGRHVPPPDPVSLEQAWATVADAARHAGIGVVLGTERVVDDRVLLTALVIDADGSRVGFQDKVQLDPSEEGMYSAGSGR